MPEVTPEETGAVARRYLVEDSRAQDVPLLERRWYYVIEVEPGVYTPGLEYDNVHLTRSALRQIDVRGLDCLDIGTMEAVVPILLARRGAGRVVAYDRLDLSERIAFLKGKLGVEFEYLSGFAFSELRGRLAPQGTEDTGRSLFDLVIFSGVLYHMLDPLAGLLGARRFLRNGGLMIMETLAVIGNEDVLHFNSRGRFFGGDNFWLPTVSCLDYLLRFARLKPLDCLHLPISSVSPRVCRVCVPCLATDEPVGAPGDDWIGLPQQYDMREHLSWPELKAAGRPPLAYMPSGDPLVRREGGSVNVYETVVAQPPASVTKKEEQVWLRLDALH